MLVCCELGVPPSEWVGRDLEAPGVEEGIDEAGAGSKERSRFADECPSIDREPQLSQYLGFGGHGRHATRH